MIPPEKIKETLDIHNAGRIMEQKTTEQTEKLLRLHRRSVQAEILGGFGHWHRDFIDDTAWWSPGLYHLFQIPLQQSAPSYRELLDLIHPEDRQYFDREVRKCLEQGRAQRIEYRAILPDGSLRHFCATAEPVADSTGAILSIRGAIHDITDRVRTERTLRETTLRVQELSRRLILLEEVERQRLARTLHDETSQDLAVLGLHLGTLQECLREDQPEHCKGLLNRSLTLVESITAKIRNIMSDLRPPVLDDYGLRAALRWYADQFHTKTTVPLWVEGEAIPRLAPSTEINLFRVIQEAVTNAVKHANPTRIVVSLNVQDPFLVIRIVDDGTGFSLDANRDDHGHDTHLGLLSMRERIEALDGELEIKSNPGEGTRIIIRVKQ